MVGYRLHLRLVVGVLGWACWAWVPCPGQEVGALLPYLPTLDHYIRSSAQHNPDHMLLLALKLACAFAWGLRDKL